MSTKLHDIVWKLLELKHPGRCEKCYAPLFVGDEVYAKRLPGARWSFKCANGCPDLSPNEEDGDLATKRSSAAAVAKQMINEIDSDLEDFIVEDEEGGAESSDDENGSQVSRDLATPGRKSLLQEKFEEYDEKFDTPDAVGSGDQLKNDDSDVEDEEEEYDEDDTVFGGGCSDSDSIDTEERERFGKLWCSVCGEYVVEDSFSAAQKRVGVDHERFCLRHTSTSAFNKTYGRPEMRAVGIRIGPPSSTSPGKDRLTSHVSPYVPIRSPPLHSSGKSKRGLDQYLSANKPHSGSKNNTTPTGAATISTLKMRNMSKELGAQGRSPGFAVSSSSIGTPVVGGGATMVNHGNSSQSARRRNTVVRDDDDEVDTSQAEVKQKTNDRRHVATPVNKDVIIMIEDSDEDDAGEWDEPIASKKPKEMKHVSKRSHSSEPRGIPSSKKASNPRPVRQTRSSSGREAANAIRYKEIDEDDSFEDENEQEEDESYSDSDEEESFVSGESDSEYESAADSQDGRVSKSSRKKAAASAKNKKAFDRTAQSSGHNHKNDPPSSFSSRATRSASTVLRSSPLISSASKRKRSSFNESHNESDSPKASSFKTVIGSNSSKSIRTGVQKNSYVDDFVDDEEESDYQNKHVAVSSSKSRKSLDNKSQTGRMSAIYNRGRELKKLKTHRIVLSEDEEGGDSGEGEWME